MVDVSGIVSVSKLIVGCGRPFSLAYGFDYTFVVVCFATTRVPITEITVSDVQVFNE
jgi:hypothetical protein